MDDEPDVPEVRPPTLEDVRTICRALHEAGARYVLIVLSERSHADPGRMKGAPEARALLLEM